MADANVDTADGYQDAFWEGYAINGSGRGAAHLSGVLRDDERFKVWLLGQPQVMKNTIRPLLLRVAHAPDVRARYLAIEAMLLCGDRSLEILKILDHSTRRAKSEPPNLTNQQRIEFLSLDPHQAKKLCVEFGLYESESDD